MNKYAPQLVSWNGGGFDLPVLHYRGLISRRRRQRVLGHGRDDREYKFNNYISRYHTRHFDLMDVLAIYQPRASAPLDAIAQPVRASRASSAWTAARYGTSYLAGGIAAIRDYCEADALNTYLLYLRFQLMRCSYTPERYQSELALVRSTLEKRGEPHWREFLSLWK